MRYRHALLAGFAMVAAASVALAASSGDPDPGFGTSGVVLTHVGDVSEAYDLVQQPDGKLVIGGYVEEGMPRATQFLLVRYLADGTLDDTFGTGGIVRTDAVPGFSTRVKALVQQGDDKLLAVGFNSTFSYWDGAGDVVLARYLTDGSLDADFGTGGIVVTDVAGFPDQGSEVLVQPDGSIVVAGFTHTDTPAGVQDALLARYTSAGVLDAGFGTGGTVLLDFGGRAERAYAVALQADGGLVIAGAAQDPTTPWSGPGTAILARVDAAGVPDLAFGTGGVAEIDLGLRTAFTSMVQLPDGKLLVDGSYTADNVSGHSFLARFDANGQLDPAFGAGDGIIDPAPGLYFGLGLTPDGAVLGTGPGFLWGHWQALGISRLGADGVLDPTFGYGGRASIWPGPTVVNTGGFAVVADPDGSTITTAGFATDGPPIPNVGEVRYIALARVLTASTSCDTDGDCDACEYCSEAGVCANGPRSTCEHPWLGGAKLLYAGVPVKPRIDWKWKAINSTPGFDPTTEGVGFCMWWDDIPIYESLVPPGAGWKVSSNGSVLFKDKLRSNFGIEKIKIGKSGIAFRAQGPNISANPNGFPDALLQPGDDSARLHVQLHTDSGHCFTATYYQGQMVTKYPAHTRRGVGY